MTAIYFCPLAGELELHPGGGFDVCCSAPELHEPVLPMVITAVLVQAADEITRTARTHIAAGRGHMTWAEAVTILHRLAATATQET